MDTIIGTAGADSINTTATTGEVRALGGNDNISIWESNGAGQFIDAGDGDDFIAIQQDFRMAPTDIHLTLGEGRDTVKIYQIFQAITISDFKAGPQGDNVDFIYTLSQWVNGWDGRTNPFAAGYFRLVQLGPNTMLQIDKHDFGQAGTWSDWILFQNTSAVDFTSENFNGASPNGSAPPNLVLQGTAGSDTLNDSYGDDHLYGGGGGDTLNSSAGDDFLDGGDGADYLIDSFGGNDRFFGGNGDDTIQASAIAVASGPGGRSAYMDGGAGNDRLSYNARAGSGAVFTGIGGAGDDSIGAAGITTATIDAGAGADRVLFDRSGAYTIALGEGRDVATAYIPADRAFAPGAHTIHITDFEAGLAGDRLDLSTYVAYAGWNGQSDLLAGGLVSITQTGADTVIQLSPFSGGNTTIVLDNVQRSALTAFNLTGISPNGPYGGMVKTVQSGSASGGDGDDLLMAGFGGAVTLNGGNGGDRLEGDEGADLLNGDAGNDVLLGGRSTDRLFGGTGADLLDGGSGSDQLHGGSDNDILIGGSDADLIDGGAGVDLFRGSHADLAGDVILDLQVGEAIKIDGVDLAHFSFARHGSTLAFSTGESLVLRNNPRGTFVATSDGANSVLLTLSESHTATKAGTFNADFNGDGVSDLAWREIGGVFTTWGVGQDHGRPVMAAPNQYVTTVMDNTWRVVAAEDFNGDGKSDLMWRGQDGTFNIYTSTGSGFVGSSLVDRTVSNDWALAATGDFNGDGKTDLIWRHSGGMFSEWNSRGAGFDSNVYVRGDVDPSWSLAGVGDFNGDGKDDMVWRHSGGMFTLWESTGAGFSPNTVIDASVSPDWSLAAVGDFNGDGKDDFIWRHAGGMFTEWRSNGHGFDKNVYVDDQVGVDWTLQSTGDFNGDGRADLLWRHDAGTFTVWTSSGDGFLHNTLVDGSVPSSWALASTDFFIG